MWLYENVIVMYNLYPLENNVNQYKQQTIIADGTTSLYNLNFDIDTQLSILFDVHIDGISQDSSTAYTINKENIYVKQTYVKQTYRK